MFGAYTAFIIPAYGLTAVVMLLLWMVSTRALRRSEERLAAMEEPAGR